MQYKKEVYKLAELCGFAVDFIKYTNGIQRRSGLLVEIMQAQWDANHCKLFHAFDSWKEACIYLIGFMESKHANVSAAELAN